MQPLRTTVPRPRAGATPACVLLQPDQQQQQPPQQHAAMGVQHAHSMEQSHAKWGPGCPHAPSHASERRDAPPETTGTPPPIALDAANDCREPRLDAESLRCRPLTTSSRWDAAESADGVTRAPAPTVRRQIDARARPQVGGASQQTRSDGASSNAWDAGPLLAVEVALWRRWCALAAANARFARSSRCRFAVAITPSSRPCLPSASLAMRAFRKLSPSRRSSWA